MKTWLVLAVMAHAACAVAEPAPLPVSASARDDSLATGSPMLGVGFGRLVTIEAEPAVDDPAKGYRQEILRVTSINGQRLADAVVIPWSYGGWHADRPETSGHKGFLVEAGQLYRLRGYETGAWVGVPHDVYPILIDEWGPPQSWGFHFRSVFRVIDGELVARAAR